MTRVWLVIHIGYVYETLVAACSSSTIAKQLVERIEPTAREKCVIREVSLNTMDEEEWGEA